MSIWKDCIELDGDVYVADRVKTLITATPSIPEVLSAIVKVSAEIESLMDSVSVTNLDPEVDLGAVDEELSFLVNDLEWILEVAREQDVM